MKIRRQHSINGFALPTVLIASVVMMTVLVTAVASATASRSALQTQQYSQLARDAAESGLAMAQACIAAGTTTWANPLRPGGTCAGLAAQCGTSACYVMENTTVRTTFSAASPTVAGDATTVNVTGTVELLKSSNGSVWRTYTQKVNKQTVSTTGTPAAEPVLWSQVAAGNGNSCGITMNSNMYCWGNNTNGAIGDNSTTHQSSPTLVSQGALPAGWNMKKVVSGSSYSCGIASDNKAYCWGINTNGQLGDASTTQRLTPVAVAQGAIPVGATIVDITVGVSHTCAIASDYKAYCWGLNTNGQLGDNSTTQRTSPVAVNQGAIPVGATIKQIGVGLSHSCALATDSKTYCWGANTNGRLGDNSTTQRLTPVAIVRGAMGVSMVHQQLAVLGNGGCVIASDNKPYCWGLNTDGQLGDNTIVQKLAPVAVVQGAMPAGFLVNQLVGGFTHTCAIANDNKAYCWGLNTNGQLGDNSTTQRNLPVAVSAGALPSGLMVRSLALGGTHTCAIASDNKSYCWGQNTNGGLGDASTTQRTTPVAVAGVNEINYMTYSALSAGSFYNCAIAADVKAYCWGIGGPALGDGSSAQNDTPGPVSQGAMPTGSMVNAISAANNHTCAIATDNKPYCWGIGNNGALGDNTIIGKNTPNAVLQGALPAGLMIRQIASGTNSTCAIASDSKPYCWGDNTSGQLGTNNTVDSLVPIAVLQGDMPAGSMVKQLVAGSSHYCVVATDSKVYCWGENFSGQIGDTTNTDRYVPEALQQGALPTDLLVKEVFAGGSSTCAIASDNKPYCWGGNSTGSLGNNSTTDTTLPVAVSQGALPAGLIVRSMSLKLSHTCAIASDNKPYCWGNNLSSKLGDGTTTNRLVPTAVSAGALPAGQLVNKISNGSDHGCVIAWDNKMYCWGSNTYRQPGDGLAGSTTRTTPVATVPLITVGPTVNTSHFYR